MATQKKGFIAYLCSSASWGGLEMNQLRNATWMQDAGYQICMIGRENSPLHDVCLAQGLPWIGIPKHRKYYDFSKGRKLGKILTQKGITHLIVRDTKDLSLAVIAKRHAGVHLSYFMEMQLGVSKKHLLHTIRFGYIDLWSCPLNWLKDQVLTMTRMNPQKVVVIPSGINLAELQKELSRTEARSHLKLPEKGTMIGLIGRFDRHKGQVLLLEALLQLSRKDVSVCFLGEPTRNERQDYFLQMTQFIKENELQNRVFIRPFRKDIATFYKAIDIFVLGSTSETFGMVTVEAMACGTPVIASNSGGSPEILGFGSYGSLYEPNNAKDLAQKIEASLHRPACQGSELAKAATKYDHKEVLRAVETALGLCDDSKK
jgi:glycosyltransferase involved in cell wall biosynthesis